MFQESPLNRDLQMTAPGDLLDDDDDAGLTEISEAFVRIPSLLIISDGDFGPKVSQPIPYL